MGRNQFFKYRYITATTLSKCLPATLPTARWSLIPMHLKSTKGRAPVPPTLSRQSHLVKGETSPKTATASLWAYLGRTPHLPTRTPQEPDANNASFNSEIGSKNDPSRLAEQKFQRQNADYDGEAGLPRQDGVLEDNAYETLKRDASA